MKHWIYPSNVKYYDVIAVFTNEKLPAWPMNSKVAVGDHVYIYLGAPYKQIGFECSVEAIDVSSLAIYDQARKYAKVKVEKSDKSFMQLKTIQHYPLSQGGPMSFWAMREYGLKGSIMGPQCLENNEELLAYILGI